MKMGHARPLVSWRELGIRLHPYWLWLEFHCVNYRAPLPSLGITGIWGSGASPTFISHSESQELKSWAPCKPPAQADAAVDMNTLGTRKHKPATSGWFAFVHPSRQSTKHSVDTIKHSISRLPSVQRGVACSSVASRRSPASFSRKCQSVPH